MSVFYVYYLGYDHIHEVPAPLEEGFEEAVVNHPKVEKYSLKDFQLAFNDEFISDLAYIVITDKGKNNE